MGLLKAGIGALSGALADSWREYFYCESMDQETLVTKGEHRAGGRSSNKKGTDNIISNGSIIAVNDSRSLSIRPCSISLSLYLMFSFRSRNSRIYGSLRM